MTLRSVFSAAAALAAASALADRIVSQDYTLSADEDWSSQGLVTIQSGVTLNLGGRTLTVDAIAGDGTISNPDFDLTGQGTASSPLAAGDFTAGSAAAAFSSDGRVIVESTHWPVVIDYDFGSATVINAYRIRNWNSNKATVRGPKEWTFYGSDDGENWTPLDEKSSEPGWGEGEEREYVFDNTTPYRHYRISFAASTGTDGYIQFRQLKYGRSPSSGTVVVNASTIERSALSGLTLDEGVIVQPSGDFALSGDFDMSGFAMAGTVDLNGHDLTVNGFDGTGMITNSSETAADLRVTVPSGKTTTNEAIPIGGNLRLVKEGAGTFAARYVPQSYTGGTLVAEGTIRAVVAGTKLPYGPNGSTITVSANAYFDVHGGSGIQGNYAFVLAGGTLGNMGAGHNYASDGAVQDVSLTADSFFSALPSGIFWGDDDSQTKVDLGGHTLSLSIGSEEIMRLYNAVFTEGIVSNVTSGGRLIVAGSAPGVLASNTDFIVNCTLHVVAKPFVVRKYESLWTNNNYNVSSPGVITVLGSFVPTTDYFWGVTLADGATLDLSTRAAALPSVSASTAGAREIAFDENAKIGVKLGKRRPALDEPLMTWTAETKPPNVDTVKFTHADEPAQYNFAVRGDGLYAVPGGFSIIIR